MQALARWTAAAFASVLALGAGGCDGKGDTGDPGGSGGIGGAAGTSQGGSAGDAGSGAGGSGPGGSGPGGSSTGGSGGDSAFSSQGKSSYETQTSLGANTTGTVAAAWIAFADDGASSIGYAVSRDGGAHWTAPQIIESPDGRMASNPVIAVDKSGVVILAWLGFRFDFNMPDEHIYVARIIDQTDTFMPPVIASDDGSSKLRDFDKPALTLGADGELLLTWADFTGSGMGMPASLVYAFSSDGASFQQVTITNDNTFGNLAFLCLDTSLGKTAPLYLVHLAANGGVALRTSVNQGQSWELRPTPAANALFQDITCAVSGGDLWIAYAAGTTNPDFSKDSPADAVEVIRSKNSGVDFDPPVKASDGAAGVQYLFPRMLRAPTGKLEIVYYQGVVDADAQLALASSSDGETWTNKSFFATGTLTIDRTTPSWLGAYVGFATPSAGQGLVTYTDNSEGKTHIQFGKLVLP